MIPERYNFVPAVEWSMLSICKFLSLWDVYYHMCGCGFVHTTNVFLCLDLFVSQVDSPSDNV